MFIIYLFLGITWGTLIEWLLHRFILHDLAAKVKADFHLEHHFLSAKNKGIDTDYFIPFYKSNARIKEILGLLFILIIHLPVILFSLWFFIGNAFVVCFYYLAHYISHRYPKFGWKFFPWHMKHHLVSAKSNFGVTTPLWDFIFRTRIGDRKRSKAFNYKHVPRSPD